MTLLTPWHLWEGHTDPFDGSFVERTPYEVREGEVVRKARRIPDALCLVVIRDNVRTKLINGWRVDRKRMETRVWRGTAVVYGGGPTVRWEWRRA